MPYQGHMIRIRPDINVQAGRNAQASKHDACFPYLNVLGEQIHRSACFCGVSYVRCSTILYFETVLARSWVSRETIRESRLLAV